MIRSSAVHVPRRSIAAVLLTLPLLFGLATEAAQAQVLVSNIGQTDGGSFGATARSNLNAGAGQSFTTGSHVKGYTLTGVGVVFEKIELDGLFRKNNPHIAATIRNDSNGLPGTTVGELTLPSTSPATFDSDDVATDKTFTFIAPGKGIKLEPSSTYFVVIEAVGERRTDVRFRTVDSNAENAGGAAGFSIADGGAEYRWYSNPPAWWPRGNFSLQIGVNGYANPITDVVQMSNATRSLAEFGNHKGNGGARFVVEIGDGLSPKGHDRTINYKVGGSADRGSGKDYTIDGCTSSSCSMRLPANRRSNWITIYVNDDGIDEMDETIVLTLQDGSGYSVNRNRVAPDDPRYTHDKTTVTIIDDDTRGLQFHRRWPAVGEGSSETLTLRLSSQPTAAVTVKIASNNPDVTVSPTSLTFNPSGSNLWSRARNVAVSAAQDDDAVDDTATLTYTTSGGDYGGANALSISRPVSVDDDDTADPTAPRLPRISVTGGAAVTEGGAASFTVNADPAPTARLTVNVEVVEPPGQDFVAASQERVRTVVLNAGATSATFTVPTVNDNSDEDDGFVQVYVNDGTGYVAGQGAVVTVRDNDDPIPGAFFRLASSDAGEGGGTHNVRVDLTRPAPSGGLTLRYGLSGTATAGGGNDFTIQGSGTLGIAAGGTSATIAVAINDDGSAENAETVILTLVGGTGYTVASPSVHTLTIADNDGTSASFASASSSAAEDAGTRSVTVNLSQAAPAGGLTLSYSVAGTATAGSGNDFTIQGSGSLSVAAGATSADIPVAINDDGAEESAETVILTLTGGTGYTLGGATVHTLTITDNDGPPPITGARLFSGTSTTLPEGAGTFFNATFDFSRQLRSTDTVTLPLTIGGTATPGTDYRLTCGPGSDGAVITCSGLDGNSPSITFDGSGLETTVRVVRRVLTLETLEDNTSESEETVTLALGSGSPLTVRITDAPDSVTLSFFRATYSVNENARVVQPIFDVTPASGSDIAVPLIFTDVSATGGADYTRIGQGVLEANGIKRLSFDIPILDDAVHEGDETFKVAIDTANLQGGVTAGSITEATVTIVDNDEAGARPALSISRSALSIPEGGTGSYTVRLAAVPTGTVAVNVASDNGDVTVSPARLTFEASGGANLWSAERTVTVSAAQDDDADDDVAALKHTASGGGYDSVAAASVDVTVRDDDAGGGAGGSGAGGAPPGDDAGGSPSGVFGGSGGAGSCGRPDGSAGVFCVQVVSDPGADGRYLAGEAIEVRVRFSEGVRAGREAALELDVGGAMRRAALAAVEGPAGDRLLFRYEVGPDDRDADGFGVPAGALAASRGAIAGRFGPVGLDLGGHALARAAGHPVGPASAPLLLSAADPGRQGFVRVINHSDAAGRVTVRARDDAGGEHGPVAFAIAARGAVHFNSTDLESGNAGKGLSGSTGAGAAGHWRLELSADVDVEALAYVRHADGFVTAVHDVAPREGGGRRLATVNPGSNFNQASRVRLAHWGAGGLAVRLGGTDDAGAASGGTAAVELPPGGAAEATAADLESGPEGGLGDGAGKWRLLAATDAPFTLMGLMEGPSGHLTNLSSAPLRPTGGQLVVPLFLSSADPWGRQGFLRVANRSDADGAVAVEARDGSGMGREPLRLALGAGRAVHINSHDLEMGNASKGLTGSTGAAHSGHWQLTLSGDLDFEVSAYARHPDGFLTAVHDAAPVWAGSHRVATFNPGSNDRQRSLLRLVNAGPAGVAVRIRGIDDAGADSAGTVSLTVPGGGSATLGAPALESGGEDFEGALGDGAGKWRLVVEPGRDAPGLRVMSLMESPGGHLTNLSTRTAVRE